MEKQELAFTLERETKNTIRYAEDTKGKPPAIGTLYVQKWLLGSEPPMNLIVSIADSDNAASHLQADPDQQPHP